MIEVEFSFLCNIQYVVATNGAEGRRFSDWILNFYNVRVAALAR